MTNPYVPLLVMMAVAGGMAAVGLALSAVIGPRSYNRVKVANYECGVEATPKAPKSGRFPVKFYLVAMTFIIFDIEVVFLYPWAAAFGELATFGLIAMLTFIVLITIPLIYEWRRGGLDWD